ncbi:MFS transporter [Caloranaerobacter sp. DY30410]|uniref:MFS transporter n=1 Tax=Caloranaerobacter sp. DY30410 TaxID=3238305 RepID=UPI003CFBCCD6
MNKNIFKNKNYSKLFWGKFVSDIGSQFYMFSLAWYLLSLTSSAVIVGYFLSFRLLLYVISAPIGGAISDRLDRIRVLIYCDFIRGLSIFINLLVIIKTGDISLILISLYISTAIHVLCDALFIPSSTAAIRFVISKKELTDGYSFIYLINNVKRILGIFFAGALYKLIGIEGIMLFNGISFVISGIFEKFINVNTKEENYNKIRLKLILSDLKDGMEFLLKLKPLFFVTMISIFSNFVYEPLARNGFTYFFNQLVKVDPIYLSTAASFTAIGSIIMTKFIGDYDFDNIINHYYRGITFKTIYVVLLVINMVFFLVGTSHFMLFFIIHLILQACYGVIIVYINVPTLVYMQKEVPSYMIGKVDSFITTFSMAIMPISTIIGSYIIDKINFLTLAIITVLAMNIIWIIYTIFRASILRVCEIVSSN